jgi:hypothetical protein
MPTRSTMPGKGKYPSSVAGNPPRLPQSISELTAERLSAILASTYPGVEVTSVHIGTAIYGSNTKVRLLLNYNEAGHSQRLPATMFAKCCFELHSRQVAEIAQSEVAFYLQRAPEGLVNAPECYFAGLDHDSRTAFLLLEDLLARNITFGFALRPIDPKIVQRALEMLARYHARWWNSPELATLGPAGGTIVADDLVSFMFDAPNFDKCLTLPRFKFVPTELHDPERFRKAIHMLWKSNAQGPQCILHGDLHLGNCYFEVDGTPGFLDWQGDTRGCWAHDVTELLLTALDIDDRRNNERPLLEFYLQQLRANGVEAPDFEEAWRQYRRNTLWSATSAVCPVEYQPEPVCAAYTQRAMAAITDLDALASFDQ